MKTQKLDDTIMREKEKHDQLYVMLIVKIVWIIFIIREEDAGEQKRNTVASSAFEDAEDEETSNQKAIYTASDPKVVARPDNA